MAAITRYCEVRGQLLFFPFIKSKREDEGGGNGGCHSKMVREPRFSESGRVHADLQSGRRLWDGLGGRRYGKVMR